MTFHRSRISSFTPLITAKGMARALHLLTMTLKVPYLFFLFFFEYLLCQFSFPKLQICSSLFLVSGYLEKNWKLDKENAVGASLVKSRIRY